MLFMVKLLKVNCAVLILDWLNEDSSKIYEDGTDLI